MRTRQFDEEDDEDEGGRDDDAEDAPEDAGGAAAKTGSLGPAGAGSARPSSPAAQAPDQRAPGPQPALGTAHAAGGGSSAGAAAMAGVEARMGGGSAAGGGGEDAPIWSRTRARQPLGHVTLEALEALLGECDDEGLWPALGDEGAAYREFLAARPPGRAQRRLAVLERCPPAAMCIIRRTRERVVSQHAV